MNAIESFPQFIRVRLAYTILSANVTDGLAAFVFLQNANDLALGKLALIHFFFLLNVAPFSIYKCCGLWGSFHHVHPILLPVCS
jgi:hypothetical protein